jgi:alpha-L-fucosidase
MRAVASVLLAAVLAMPSRSLGQDGKPPAAGGGARLAKPSPEQVEYLGMELQMFVCLDPCTWQNREYDNHSTPLSAINPSRLDTDQWCRVAKSFGAGQVLFVAKHTGGFCWWQTETSAYSIKNTPWRGGKGDVLAELSKSCRKHGLKLGIYVYPGDDQWGAGIGSGGRTADPARQSAYNVVFRQQMTEVLSRYGEVAEVWFDGSCVIEVGDILKRHAPRAMVFQGPYTTLRWVGNEAGTAPYPAWQTVKKADAAAGIATAGHSDPAGDVWLPMECDTTLLDHKWFWGRNTDHMLKDLDRLMDIYYQSVGRGCVLLLNSTPDTTGLIPDLHVKRYEEFGREIARRFGRSDGETRGEGDTVEIDLGRPTAINHAITMEDIREGQRVRAYRLEGLTESGWKSLVPGGLSIGHKQIDFFPSTDVSRVRLVVTKSAARPLIRRLAVFHVEGFSTGRRLADACWSFEEGRGTTTRADPDGMAEVSGVRWAQGRHGKALDFATKEGFVSLGNIDLGDGDFTVAAWVFPRGNRSGQDRILAKERIGVVSNQFRLYLHEGDRLGFAMTGYGGGVPYPFVSAPGSVPLGQWTHTAVTRRGRQFTLYINGKEAGHKETGGVLSHRSQLELRVGAAYAASGNRGDYGFDGLIDELRIYDRALSAAELADPESLPSPGWTKAGAWPADAWGPQWTTRDIDLTAGIAKPGQYEIHLRPAGVRGTLEIRTVELLIAGRVIPDRVRPLPGQHRFSLYRMEQTTADFPTAVRVVARILGTPPCAGDLYVRPQ